MNFLDASAGLALVVGIVMVVSAAVGWLGGVIAGIVDRASVDPQDDPIVGDYPHLPPKE